MKISLIAATLALAAGICNADELDVFTSKTDYQWFGTVSIAPTGCCSGAISIVTQVDSADGIFANTFAQATSPWTITVNINGQIDTIPGNCELAYVMNGTPIGTVVYVFCVTTD